MATTTLAAHPILASGIGTRARMAALRKVLRECAPTESVLVALNAAAIALGDEAHADADAPATPAKRGPGRPAGSRDRQPRKRRSDAGKSRKPAAPKPAAPSGRVAQQQCGPCNRPYRDAAIHNATAAHKRAVRIAVAADNAGA